MRSRALIVTLWIGAAAIAVYWGLWFLGGRALLASSDAPGYIAFENAFPVADAWLALTYAASALALARDRPSAAFWLVAAASGSFYLAGMDILYDLENGVYVSPERGAAVTELVINLCTLGLGAWTAVRGWHIVRAWQSHSQR